MVNDSVLPSVDSTADSLGETGHPDTKEATERKEAMVLRVGWPFLP